MKRNQFLILFYSLFGLLSWCCSSENGVDEPSSGEPSTVSLYAGYGDDDDSSTRTTLDEFANVKWSATDVINVNGQKSTQTTLLNDGAKAVFSVAATAPYYALYATSSGVILRSDHTFSIIFPSEQPYKDNVSFSDGVNPSVAVSTTEHLSFYNVCGIVKAQIKANLTGVRKIRFLSADKNVAGQAIVDPSNKSLHAIPPFSVPKMDITFSSDQTLTTSSPLTIRWVLPTGTYGAGWKIQLVDSENGVLLEKNVQNALTVTRSKTTNVGTLTYASDNAPEIIDGVKLNGLLWAPGNLRLKDGTYQFYKSQECYSGIWNGGDYWCWDTLDPMALSSSNTTGIYDASTDPCTKVVPTGTWRMPTRDELTALVNAGNVSGTYNGLKGYFFGTTSAPVDTNKNTYVFMPEAGSRTGEWDKFFGRYWSSTSRNRGIYNLFVYYGDSAFILSTSYDQVGLAIRCVSTQ